MANSSGSRKGRSAQGRATPKGGGNLGRYTDPETSGRYTKPTPTSAKVSPRWWAPVMLILMALGVVTILLNYLSVFGNPSGWFMLTGVVMIAAGFLMSTSYR